MCEYCVQAFYVHLLILPSALQNKYYLHFTDEETEAQGEFGNILKVTHLVIGKTKIWIQICVFQKHAVFPNIVTLCFPPGPPNHVCVLFSSLKQRTGSE